MKIMTFLISPLLIFLKENIKKKKPLKIKLLTAFSSENLRNFIKLRLQNLLRVFTWQI